MTAPMIDHNMVMEFSRRSRRLIAAIEKAVADFYASPPVGSDKWEGWRTPRPWETKALRNLSDYQEDINKATVAFDAGDALPIEKVGSYYASLSKDMDFDTSWMTNENKVAVNEAIDDVTEIADRIHRIGYATRHHSA